MAPRTLARDLDRSRRELQTLDREIANLTTAIAQGGHVPPLVEALKTQHARRDALTETIAARDTARRTQIDRRGIEAQTRQVVEEWQAALTVDDVPLVR